MVKAQYSLYYVENCYVRFMNGDLIVNIVFKGKISTAAAIQRHKSC